MVRRETARHIAGIKQASSPLGDTDTSMVGQASGSSAPRMWLPASSSTAYRWSTLLFPAPRKGTIVELPRHRSLKAGVPADRQNPLYIRPTVYQQRAATYKMLL